MFKFIHRKINDRRGKCLAGIFELYTYTRDSIRCCADEYLSSLVTKQDSGKNTNSAHIETCLKLERLQKKIRMDQYDLGGTLIDEMLLLILCRDGHIQRRIDDYNGTHGIINAKQLLKNWYSFGNCPLGMNEFIFLVKRIANEDYQIHDEYRMKDGRLFKDKKFIKRLTDEIAILFTYHLSSAANVFSGVGYPKSMSLYWDDEAKMRKVEITAATSNRYVKSDDLHAIITENSVYRRSKLNRETVHKIASLYKNYIIGMLKMESWCLSDVYPFGEYESFSKWMDELAKR